MDLMQAIHIERFRSLTDVCLQDLSDFVTLVGPNNSGKSNILRALNLFFNDETDARSWLDFERDYALAARRKERKYISVAVRFKIPASLPGFLRKGLEEVGDYLGDEFWIRKKWTLKFLYAPEIEIKRNSSTWREVSTTDEGKIRQFLDLISFRYIPNRAVPADVIREEWRAIRRELARRVKRSAGTAADQAVRETLRRIAGRMVLPIASDLKKCCAGLGDVELATPEGLAEMLEPSVFRAGLGEPAQGKVDDTALGAGVQALLMFHVLHTLIDKQSFRGSFGWKQAAIWAVEEPESSLHRELQLHLAGLLRSYAVGNEKRFQIVASTHSEVFVYAATAGFAVTQRGAATIVVPENVPELARKAANDSVTGWTHPALKFPMDTVVLVEGEIDAKVLARAAELLGKGRRFVFCSPSQLDEGVSGDGIAQVKQFVKRHGAALGRRLPRYPLLVVMDWDQRSSVGEIARNYGADGPRYVRAMDESFADAAIGDTFRGIERFYSSRILEMANRQHILPLGRTDDGLLMAQREDLERNKARLCDLFCAEATPSDCCHLQHVLEWAEQASGI